MRYPYAGISRENSDSTGTTCAALPGTGLIWSFYENKWHALSLKSQYKVVSTLASLPCRDYLIRNFMLTLSDINLIFTIKKTYKNQSGSVNVSVHLYLYIFVQLYFI